MPQQQRYEPTQLTGEGHTMKRNTSSMPTALVPLMAAAALLLSFSALSKAIAQPPSKIKKEARERIIGAPRAGGQLEFIVEVVDPEAQSTALQGRSRTPAQMSVLRARRASKKRSVLSRHPRAKRTRDFSHLPLMIVRAPSVDVLNGMLADQDVFAVYDNELLAYPSLAESLPDIRQTAVLRETPFTGEGYSIAVLDTGVDFTQPDFGSCQASSNGWQPQQSSNCRIKLSLDFGDDDGVADDSANSHGTNVAGIVAGVAPGADIIVLDVFRGQNTQSGDQIAALNWVVENAFTYHIVAVNMSLGGIWDKDSDNTANAFGDVNNNGVGDLGYVWATCPGNLASAFASVLAQGAVPVVASGNQGLAGAVTNPACEPLALAVGRTYVEDLGFNSTSNALISPLPGGNNAQGFPINGYDVGTCNRANPQNGTVHCTSNSALEVDIVAPGTNITAGGVKLGGTSMAAPHVAGTAALIAEASNGLSSGLSLWADLLATTRTRNDPKWADMAFLDVVGSVLAASPWTSIVDELPPASWYEQLPDTLLLSTVGLAHELYGVDTSGSTAPLESRLIAPLFVSIE